MDNYILNHHYSGSLEPININDSVIVDDRSGLIVLVCMPQTKPAEDYYCEDTGGILVRFTDGLLELLPFGHSHKIVKIK